MSILIFKASPFYFTNVTSLPGKKRHFPRVESIVGQYIRGRQGKLSENIKEKQMDIKERVSERVKQKPPAEKRTDNKITKRNIIEPEVSFLDVKELKQMNEEEQNTIGAEIKVLTLNEEEVKQLNEEEQDVTEAEIRVSPSEVKEVEQSNEETCHSSAMPAIELIDIDTTETADPVVETLVSCALMSVVSSEVSATGLTAVDTTETDETDETDEPADNNLVNDDSSSITSAASSEAENSTENINRSSDQDDTYEDVGSVKLSSTSFTSIEASDGEELEVDN